jgi:2,4-dienoyl-CoA reductase-like NADH-dependent reductase (Old Yellow Enzyme family)
LAVMRRVREVVGAEYPVAYRYSPEETWEPGMTVTDTNALLEALREFDLAYISVSTGDYWQPGLRDPSDLTPRAVIAKRHLPDTPVVGVGKVWTRGDAERILENGTDLVALGRALICDPEWTQRAKDGLEPRLGYEVDRWQENDVPPGLHRRIEDVKGWFPILETA